MGAPVRIAGFRSGADVVTMVPVESFVDIIPVFKTSEPLIDHFARVMRAGGTGIYWSRGTCLLAVNPGHARILAEDGYDRQRLQERLFEEAMIPLSDMPHGNIPQGDWTVVGGKVLLTESPDDIYIAVAGGPEPYHTVYMTASAWRMRALLVSGLRDERRVSADRAHRES
jgi:hypothetical protein